MRRGPAGGSFRSMGGCVVTFGELSVLHEGTPADLGGPKQRLLLALLVSRANSVLRVDELIDSLWTEGPPRTARKNLQVYVSKLRRIFGDRLTHVQGGYRLRIGPEECDLLCFEQLARTGRRSAREGEPDRAADLLGRAVAAWHGRPLAEFGDRPCLAAELDRLQELFLSVLEDWAELETDRGGHRLVLDRLQDHVRTHVLRERLAVAWMRALAAAGRANEALAHFESVRRALADELGVRPGPALAGLHGWLLRSPAAVRQQPGPGNQLPRDLPDFVGRAVEVHRLVAHFGSGRGQGVVVVSGSVGAGKSAFAVHVAHLLADSFPDGALLVGLGDRSTHAVLGDLLETVGLRGEHSVTHALARWRSWISARRLLIVLDDAVREDTVRALLPGTGTSAVIVTSRNRLSGVEAVPRVDLPGLNEAESAELLGRIVGPGRVMADQPAAREILRCCEGLPLAVRITGARLNALRHVRLAEYADRLRGAPRLLDEMAVGGLVLRERYESFYRGLSEQQRLAFHRLVALAPPFEHARVTAALAGPVGTAQPALESLFECNLLTVPDGEVGTSWAAYGMSAFAYGFGRELAPRSAGPLP